MSQNTDSLINEISNASAGLFTDKEAAEFLRMSRVTLWKERMRGKISFRRCAGKLFYTKQDLTDYVERAKRGFGVTLKRQDPPSQETASEIPANPTDTLNDENESNSNVEPDPALEEDVATTVDTVSLADTRPEADHEEIERMPFGSGIDLLVNGGTSQAEASLLLNQLANEYGEQELMDTIEVTRKQNSTDPKAWLIGALRLRAALRAPTLSESEGIVKTP